MFWPRATPARMWPPSTSARLAGRQAASTRIRLAGEQDVIAIARMPDGSFKQARQNVRVTIGGCGG
jgi:sulfur-oxidizing protein SoxY